ncbi:MAG: aldehyde dehydrogenase family protein [Pedobacter sp.]
MSDVTSQIDSYVAKAQEALKVMWTLDQEQVDKIVHNMAVAGAENARRLAQLGIDETGMGNLDHQEYKNWAATELLWKMQLEGKKSVGVIGEKDGIIEVAEPFGIVVAVTPAPHPGSNPLFKSLIALKGRNVLIVSYHPKAKESTIATCRVMRDAAIASGAPENCIQWVEEPSMEATNYLMKHPKVSMVAATGGGALVKAAYSSGHPALGVGAGNCPAYIDKTANLSASVNTIIASKTFDNGSICSSEQVLIFDDQAVADKTLKLFSERGAYVCNEEEKAKLLEIMFDLERGVPSIQIVAKPATRIAELAGIEVPHDTKMLLVPVKEIGPSDYMSHEKLSPVLGWYVADGKDAAIKAAVDVLEFGGAGHTAALHSNDEDVQMEYGMAVPAGRVLFNQGSAPGSFGTYNPAIGLTFMIGCGARGGNIFSENITFKHMLNIKRMVKRSNPMTEEDNFGKK